jgi:hypothetical protein
MSPAPWFQWDKNAAGQSTTNEPAAAVLRKRSTRHMLSEALSLPDTNEGEGYAIATGEEGEAATHTAATEPQEKWVEDPNALQPKSSWKQSWRKLLGKKEKASKKADKKNADGAKIAPFSVANGRKGSAWKAPTSEKCVVCTKTVYPMEKLQADGSIYHKSCFRCAECTKVSEPTFCSEECNESVIASHVPTTHV